MTNRFEAAMSKLPLVAILRGVKPDEAIAILEVLVEAGFAMIEIPLNSPEPFLSIAAMRRAAPSDVLVGAGTVLSLDDVARLVDAGGDLMVSPNVDPEVLAAATAARLTALPGVATPSEAFAALKAGADGLKAFPAEALPAPVVKAWRAVIPRRVPILPVGGVTPANMAPYVAAGATGFGLGSALYKPGDSASAVGERARQFAAAWRALQPQPGPSGSLT